MIFSSLAYICARRGKESNTRLKATLGCVSARTQNLKREMEVHAGCVPKNSRGIHLFVLFVASGFFSLPATQRWYCILVRWSTSSVMESFQLYGRAHVCTLLTEGNSMKCRGCFVSFNSPWCGKITPSLTFMILPFTSSYPSLIVLHVHHSASWLQSQTQYLTYSRFAFTLYSAISPGPGSAFSRSWSGGCSR